MADPQPQPPQDDPDPIVASYSVFLKPDLPQNQRLLVLQHPNVQDGGSRTPPPPTELRIKPRTGMVELDLPIDLSAAYDKDKGQRWGGVLARSVQAKAGGSLGLAGGFGIGAPPQRAGGGRGGAGGGGGSRLAALGDEDLAVDWNEAVRTDRVLRTQTLGGMATGPEQREARYMVGVFQGNTLHLTPATASVHLRPQLHHIDATAEAERTKPREGGAPGSGAAGAGGPGGGGGGAGAGGKEAPARAIHMTIKSAGGDGDEVTTETMADRLRAVQTEGWRRMTYHGEDTDAAWAMYDETLVLRDHTSTSGDNTAQPEQEDNNNSSSNSKDKGKGKEPAASTDVPGPSAEGLSRRFGGLRTDWGEEETLRAISGLRKDKDGVVVKVEPPAESKADAKAAETKKGKGGRAAGRKTARGKASTAMEID